VYRRLFETTNAELTAFPPNRGPDGVTLLALTNRTGLLSGDGDHVSELQLRSSSSLDVPVHLYLVGLDQLARMRPVLGETGQFEELTQPNRQLGYRNVLDR
jgi:hypothetical protein